MHRLVHSILACILLGLAAAFLDSKPVFSTSQAFNVMAAVMPERAWGLALLPLGAFGAATVSVKGWVMRTIAACALSFAHAVIAFMLFMGNHYGTGTVAYLGYAAAGAGLAYSTAHLGTRGRAGVAAADTA